MLKNTGETLFAAIKREQQQNEGKSVKCQETRIKVYVYYGQNKLFYSKTLHKLPNTLAKDVCLSHKKYSNLLNVFTFRHVTTSAHHHKTEHEKKKRVKLFKISFVFFSQIKILKDSLGWLFVKPRCRGIKVPGTAPPALHILRQNILPHLDVEKKKKKVYKQLFLSFPTDSQI